MPDTEANSRQGLSAPYTANKAAPRESSEQLRARIPGWGVDLDPRDRPSFPREQPGIATGAHWDFPERQAQHGPREMSIEHGTMPPVFGTSAPLRGVSGAIRKYAYRYSEARAAHWLLLIAADRVDAGGHHIRSLATLRPDNPITETGVTAEVSPLRFPQHLERNRVDRNHGWIDPFLVGAPWILAGVGALAAVRALRRR